MIDPSALPTMLRDAARWIETEPAHESHPVLFREAADEIERIHRALFVHTNDAARMMRERSGEGFALARIIAAWDILKTGDYTRDIVETWLEQEMKPAIDNARACAVSNGNQPTQGE